MKKLIALSMAVLMFALCFAACGKTEGTDAPEAKSYVIYSDNSFAPFEFLDEATNTYIGVDMDILAAVAEDQGFTYEMHNEGFDASMGAVQSGQADAMIAGMTINDVRKETYDFSDGYFQDGSILVVAEGNDAIKSEADLAGKKLAAKTGTVSTEYAESIKDQYGFEIAYFEGSPEMYQAVASGNADACFEDYSVIAWAIKQGTVKLQTVGEVINPSYYGFAVKKGLNAELITAFNAGLENIKANGKYEEILAKYGYSSEDAVK